MIESLSIQYDQIVISGVWGLVLKVSFFLQGEEIYYVSRNVNLNGGETLTINGLIGAIEVSLG